MSRKCNVGTLYMVCVCVCVCVCEYVCVCMCVCVHVSEHVKERALSVFIYMCAWVEGLP